MTVVRVITLGITMAIDSMEGAIGLPFVVLQVDMRSSTSDGESRNYKSDNDNSRRLPTKSAAATVAFYLPNC